MTKFNMFMVERCANMSEYLNKKVLGSELGQYDKLSKEAQGLLNIAQQGLSWLSAEQAYEHLKFIEYALLAANRKGVDAGFSGSMSDGGQRQLEREVELFIYGLMGQTPKNAWGDLIKKYARDNDPEYDKYLELKKKFE